MQIPTNSWFKDIIGAVYTYGALQHNQRTNTNVKSMPNAVVSIDLDVLKAVPTTGLRRVYPHVAAAELAWTLMANPNVKWLQKYTPMWNKFIDANGDVPAHYGQRWRKAFGRDQLQEAINTLNNDPSNRQVSVFAWDPGQDGLENTGQMSNIPCPMGFTINLINGKLNMSVFQRSCDLVVGLPYDVMMYALLMDALAVELNAEKGNLTFLLSHAHIYEPHWSSVEEMLHLDVEPESVPYPAMGTHTIETYPDEYVKAMKTSQLGRLHKFMAVPEVIA